MTKYITEDYSSGIYLFIIIGTQAHIKALVTPSYIDCTAPDRHTTLKQRRNDVVSTLCITYQINVESTLFQCCVPAGTWCCTAR